MAVRLDKGSPSDEDIIRLANNLQANYGDVIEDKATFEQAFRDYLMSDEKGKLGLGAMKNVKNFRENTWEQYFKNFKRAYKLSSGRENTDNQALFKIARGKVLPRDQLRTAKVVYPDTEEGRIKYVDKGASRSDLKGLDTKLSNKQLKIIALSKRKFEVIGRQKERVVKAREIYINIRGKKKRRFIDKRGRYVSVKKR